MGEAKPAAHAMEHSTEYMLMGVSVLVAIVAIVMAIMRFSRRPELEEARGFGRVLANKWYVDEFYNAIVVRPVNWLSGFPNKVIENETIDWMVNAVGRVVQYSSRQVRLIQSGQVGSYVLLMVLSMLAFFAIQFFLKK
jgi:NADH-quinone oxidoreductase subunit L